MELNSFLSKAFISTLGEMTFIDATMTNDNPISNSTIGFKLTILRPFSEELFVFFPKKVVSEMVDNMFDDQENIHTPEMIFDCVAEFLNIFAGKYFQLATPDKLFELGLPEKAQVDEIGDNHHSISFKTLAGEVISVYHRLDS